MYTTLARAFPVCCASDEFYYFPQVVLDDADWSFWDDFSPERIDEITADLVRWETVLEELLSTGPDLDTRIDIDLLSHSARTLREQLQEVRFHRTQPTFHLTVATLGLMEALDTGNREIWKMRVGTLPRFLDRAGSILRDVPALYRELGLEMLENLKHWAGSLPRETPCLPEILHSLDGFRQQVDQVRVRESFLLPLDLMERIVASHMAAEINVEDALKLLADEKRLMIEQLKQEVRELHPGQAWQDYWEVIPHQPLSRGGKRELLMGEIRGLERHCLELGLISPDLARACRVQFAQVPQSMTAVRAADSYSARPGHPPSGGTFFVFGGGSLGQADKTIHPVYRMTAAHETYPGHHLLDLSRWNLDRSVRRSLERPVFYEGWACFAEQLLMHTGYFSQPWDRYILARRRLRHAARGTVDLLLHTGRLDLEDGAELLAEAGFSKERAMETVRKYALRPGYQMCYTIGYGRFRQLFERYGGSDVSGFARTVLTQGEIGFDHLEKVLERSSNQ